MKNKVLSYLIAVSIIILTFTVSFYAVQTVLLYPTPYRDTVLPLCTEYKVEPALCYAVIKAESGFRVKAESSAGAKGLMQIMPATAEFIANQLEAGGSKAGDSLDNNNLTNYDLFDAETNIRFGIFYLSYLSARFSTQREILAAYNAGEGTVRRWLQSAEYSADGKTLQTIPYAETKNYVEKVEKYFKKYLKIRF